MVHSFYIYVDDLSKFLGRYFPQRGVGVDDSCVVDEEIGWTKMRDELRDETFNRSIVGDIDYVKVSIVL